MRGDAPQIGWQRRSRLRWRALRWPLLGAAGAATIVLGALGFESYFALRGEVRSWWDLVYLSLQLFQLESGAVAGEVPWQLQAARFLAPALLAFAVLQALAAFFWQQFQALRAGRMRRHVVVCGLGRKGQLLARRFRLAGETVAAIELDEDNPGVALCREAGVAVLLGDATEPMLLRRAGVGRARLVVAVCGRDGDNAAIAVAARELAAGRDGPPLVAVVHLVDTELCSLLRERELMAPERGRFRLEFFNVFESGAEAMREAFPWRDEPSPHVVVVGCGHFGEALLRRLVRSRRAAAAAGFRVTVVDRDPVRLARARALCEAAAGWQLDTLELDVRSPAFAAARFAFDTDGRPAVSGIYVCLDDDGAALAAGLALNRRLGGEGIPIVVRTEEESGLATLLRRAGEGADSFRHLHGFGLLERTCQPERLLAAGRETLAQAIHARYLAQREAAGETREENPSLVPWPQLGEDLRESNRAQADDIGRKLSAIGCDLAAAAEPGGEPFAFRSEEIERLAEMEHERFVEERLAAGWTHAPGPKNLERKTSPHLGPWAELDEPTREIDRETVRGLPAFLGGIGFRIRRRAPVDAAGGAG
jgi:Trk K+ transport system NAD-binding subunit